MSNLTQEELTLIEAENQYWVELHNALERLHNNEDFKKVILEGYFKDKAIDGVSALANDYVIQNGKRTEVMEALIAISHLQDYFITIGKMVPPKETAEDDVEE